MCRVQAEDLCESLGLRDASEGPEARSLVPTMAKSGFDRALLMHQLSQLVNLCASMVDDLPRGADRDSELSIQEVAESIAGVLMQEQLDIGPRNRFVRVLRAILKDSKMQPSEWLLHNLAARVRSSLREM